MQKQENIYDIRKNEEHMYILSKKMTEYIPSDDLLSDIAIAVNLYYTDTIEWYLHYLDMVPEGINIYIITSNDLVKKKIEQYGAKRKNIILLQKDNRGRDLSGLLVTFRKYALNYRYICFLHDKKAKSDYQLEDAERWVNNLWDNTIGSQYYLYNVLQLLEKSEELGVLVPPEPIGRTMKAWYNDAWGKNFSNCIELSKKMHLVCDLDCDKQPFTLGTVFWAKTKCLKKLFEIEWKYEDFPEEPMPIDGTISHALERMIGYIAQDAGYKTGTIMSDNYAAWCMLFIQDNMKRIFGFFDSEYDAYTLDDVHQLRHQKNRLKKFSLKYQQVYLYGAGKYGRILLNRILKYNINPMGFIVSNGQKKSASIDGFKVYELCEIDLQDPRIGIIISVDDTLKKDIESVLISNGFSNYIFGKQESNED